MVDQMAFRNAMSRFASGVTVVTAQTENGPPMGFTASAFSSLSLDPPLVLWCLDKEAASLPTFNACTRFAVNVLSAHQHHLSRQFATRADDKFAGVATVDGPGGVPLIEDVLARFVCKNMRQIDGGDHVIVIGEVEHYETFGGEPLVFHSGFYRVATRHPEVDQA